MNTGNALILFLKGGGEKFFLFVIDGNSHRIDSPLKSYCNPFCWTTRNPKITQYFRKKWDYSGTGSFHSIRLFLNRTWLKTTPPLPFHLIQVSIRNASHIASQAHNYSAVITITNCFYYIYITIRDRKLTASLSDCWLWRWSHWRARKSRRHLSQKIPARFYTGHPGR